MDSHATFYTCIALYVARVRSICVAKYPCKDTRSRLSNLTLLRYNSYAEYAYRV